MSLGGGGLAIVIVESLRCRHAQPTSSTAKNQDKGMRPHIAAREAQGACVH